ncbi:hypothetical protein [Singulisphaera sp. GP187]|uniref:hypothetical protein n=1 Tax=Singulisphaera sp. GP187 TaxID=1882752 RepID=UPI00094140A5|nr:hypothetical protein [Singulisphaera sp. GP187]
MQGPQVARIVRQDSAREWDGFGVRRAEEESSQSYGSLRETGTTELVSVAMHDADWLKAFNASADRDIAANRTYQEVLERVEVSDGDFDAELDRAKGILETARREIQDPIFRKTVDRQLTQHDGLKSLFSESAKHRAEVLGHAAADWKA